MAKRSYLLKICLAIMAIFGWFALIAQFYIYITTTQTSIPETIIRYFSYFTILTNLLVTICSTTLLFQSGSTGITFFSRQKTLTAITVYILVVGIIYNLILRFLWNPRGLQKIVDEILHTVIPLLFLTFWIVFVTRERLKARDLLPWLIYPLSYIIFILIRGAFSGFYPYPFVNVTQLGLNKVLVNLVCIAGAFILLSLLFIFIGNRRRYSK